MRRAASIVLLLSFLTFGSGALEHLHNLEHAREDAGAGHPGKHHDESNCFVHAQLHLPTLAFGWVPLLVFLGVLIAFVSEFAPPLISQRAFSGIDCRGPPTC